ncbi:hypothetical protein QVD17_36151 [Tagetes erecta]|uniref:Uncharacterized protein n=1 Tax=Tagetes erecta TaxID=13708 RepID=A0AAD8NH50_TARER|nr:hypothetical protein QVD17_36151 [Tagetes erecta]
MMMRTWCWNLNRMMNENDNCPNAHLCWSYKREKALYGRVQKLTHKNLIDRKAFSDTICNNGRVRCAARDVGKGTMLIIRQVEPLVVLQTSPEKLRYERGF